MQDLVTEAWLAERATAILVTHDVPEAVRLADRVLLLEHGTVTLRSAEPGAASAPCPLGRRGRPGGADPPAADDRLTSAKVNR